MLFGSTVYTFAIILAVFLSGLGIGSTAAAYCVRWIKCPLRWLAVAQLSIACLIPLTNYMITRVVPYQGRPAVGAHNMILVPGNGFTGAHSWFDDWYGEPNASAMTRIVDPIRNVAFEVHQYLDGNSSGQSPAIVSPTIGSERLAEFTGWLRAHGYRGWQRFLLGSVSQAVASHAKCSVEIVRERREPTEA